MPAAAATDPPSPDSVLRGTKSSGLAVVLAPATDGLVKGDRARIRVRLRPGARSFQAWLGTTDVTRRFRRRGTQRVAAIRAPLGINHLFVRVRGRRGVRDFDHVRFIRARRMPSLLARRGTGRVVGLGNVRITFSVARRTATVRASSLSLLSFQNVQTAANPACQNPTFNQQEFNDAQGQVAQELRAGAGVSQLIENLQSPLGRSADAANANVLEIAQAIQSTVGNSNANASGDTAQVIDDLMYVASAIVPEGGAALGAGASIYGLVNAALDDASGGPLLDTVETNATQLLVDFAEDYEAVWSQTAATGNIFLSDWGKLSAAYQRSLTSWSWSAQDTTNGADALTAAAKLFTFEALVPLEYQTYDFGDSGYRQTLPVPPPDGRDYQCPSKSLQFPDQTVPQEFQPFTGGPSPGLSVVTQAGPVTDLWMLGSTNPAFLSNDPDTRTNASSYIPQTLYSAMFSDPVNEDISSPVLPSELRFDLDVYDAPSTLTANGGFSPDVYCNVNGQRPS